jgi:excisionase family DNA binding protein
MERPETGEFVTIPEAARRSGLGLRQFRRAIATGDLPVYDVGGWPRVRWREVLEWIDASRRVDGGRPVGVRAPRDGGAV